MHKNHFPRILVGCMLLIIGIILLITNFLTGTGFLWSLVWPIFILIPGILLMYLWFSSDNKHDSYGLLIPSTILVSISITLFINMFFTVILNYGLIWVWTSFAYTGSVGLALWISSIYAPKKKGLILAAKILAVISFVVLVFSIGNLLLVSLIRTDILCKLWPFAIICPGILILASPLWHAFFRKGKWFGRSEKEWKNWGENFGKDMEKMGKDLGKNMKNTFDPKDKD